MSHPRPSPHYPNPSTIREPGKHRRGKTFDLLNFDLRNGQRMPLGGQRIEPGRHGSLVTIAVNAHA